MRITVAPFAFGFFDICRTLVLEVADDAFFGICVSDANRHWLNAGFGCKYDSFKWNFAYQYAFSDRDVSGSPFGLADGSYKSRFQGMMLNCNLQF